MNTYDSDMGKVTFISITFLFCFFSFTEAMFFTNSKDNDYPRIGKRPLPSSVYKTWLSKNEKIEYLPYGFQNVQDNNGVADRRHGVFHWTNDIDDIRESSRASVLVAGEGIDRNLYRMLMSYLESDDDLNF